MATSEIRVSEGGQLRSSVDAERVVEMVSGKREADEALDRSLTGCMIMERIPEPELMDSPEQTAAYAGADFSESNDLVAGRVMGLLGDGEAELNAVDLGCGPADIAIRLAKRLPRARIDAVDAGPSMLARAREALVAEGLLDRIRLIEARLPTTRLEAGHYDVVLSNSLLHHLPDPMALWEGVRNCAKAGATVCVMDLRRPANLEAAHELTQSYAGDAPDVLRNDFFNSLRAAYNREEVVDQLRRAGLDELDVEEPTDRHLLVCGRLRISRNAGDELRAPV